MSWDMVPLGDVVDILSGFAFKSTSFSNSEGMPLIRIRDVKRGYTNTYFNDSFDKKFVINNNDILIGMDGEFNVGSWPGPAALLNQRVCHISPLNEKLDKQYLFHFLPKQLKEIERKTSFVTVKHLSVQKIKGIKIPLPPLPEQKRIAAILDKADALRRKRKQALDMADEFLRATFLDMFGDPVTNPKGWDVKELRELLQFLTSGSRGWAKHYSDEGSIFLRIQNVKKGKLSLSDVQHVIPPKTKESERTKVQKGDLLISITADLGRTAVVDKHTAQHGAHINQHLALVRLNKDIVPEYISAFIESIGGKNQFKGLDQVGVKSGLNFDAIKSLKIPLPPKKLQKKFLAMQLKNDIMVDKISTDIKLSDSLFASLSQKAFKGEL